MAEAPGPDGLGDNAKETPSEPEIVLEADHVSLSFGGVHALADVSFQVRRRELFSIIGPNGAGKTSMVNCISGRPRDRRGRLASTW